MRGNSRCLLVFTNLLAHADQTGMVDIHPRAIADEVGLSQDDVKAALVELEDIDPESRSPEQDGRRIIRLDGHRAWGWQITNYVKYRSIHNEDERREQNRLAQARWRDKNKQTVSVRNHVSAQSAHTDADADADTEGDAKKTKRTARGSRLPEPFDPDFQFAVDAGIQNTLEEAAKFRDYWRAQPGQKGVKLDWPATWRNWCRNAKPPTRAAPESFRERDERAARERFEQATGRSKSTVIDGTTTFLEIGK